MGDTAITVFVMCRVGGNLFEMPRQKPCRIPVITVPICVRWIHYHFKQSPHFAKCSRTWHCSTFPCVPPPYITVGLR